MIEIYKQQQSEPSELFHLISHPKAKNIFINKKTEWIIQVFITLRISFIISWYEEERGSLYASFHVHYMNRKFSHEFYIPASWFSANVNARNKWKVLRFFASVNFLDFRGFFHEYKNFALYKYNKKRVMQRTRGKSARKP